MSGAQVPAGAWRWLRIGDTVIPLRPEDVPALYEAKIVYDCGDGHDLHLDPSRVHDVRAVETLCLALDQTARRLLGEIRLAVDDVVDRIRTADSSVEPASGDTSGQAGALS